MFSRRTVEKPVSEDTKSNENYWDWFESTEKAIGKAIIKQPDKR